jgi:hypothetical protein
MKRRREHGDCDTKKGGRGCLVFGSKVCTHEKKEAGRSETVRKWVGRLVSGNVVLWWLAALLAGLTLAFGWSQIRGVLAKV